MRCKGCFFLEEDGGDSKRSKMILAQMLYLMDKKKIVCSSEICCVNMVLATKGCEAFIF